MMFPLEALAKAILAYSLEEMQEARSALFKIMHHINFEHSPDVVKEAIIKMIGELNNEIQNQMPVYSRNSMEPLKERVEELERRINN